MDRRCFLKGLTLAALLPQVMCDKATLNPLIGYRIDTKNCRGCAQCVPLCKKSAIKVAVPSTYNVVHSQCIACLKCEPVCPSDALEFNEKDIPTINQEVCIHCGECFLICPTVAIEGSLTLASIEPSDCSRCGECVELGFCPYDAIYAL